MLYIQEAGDFTMALRPIFIAVAALASLAACNLNSNNNTAANAAADNSAAPVATNAAADNSASNTTRTPMVGGGDNQH
jgi:hypothetical protein